MKTYTMCLCDDDSNIRKTLRKYLVQYAFTSDIDVEIIESDSAEDLLTLPFTYDILFLDIRFGNKNLGINIAEKLREKGNDCMIIIITSLKSYAIEGYRAEPFRFLVKPFTQNDIFNILTACLKKLNRVVPYIKIVSDSSTEMIRADKIKYIYSKQRKRHVVCAGDITLTTWQSLHELMQSLPHEKFAFTQKSYIANLDMVDSVKNDKVILTDHSELPLGKHFEDTFMKALFLNAGIDGEYL